MLLMTSVLSAQNISMNMLFAQRYEYDTNCIWYIFIDETLKLFSVLLTVKCFLFYLYLLMLSKESLIIILICCVYFNCSIKIRFSYITCLINAFSLNFLICGIHECISQDFNVASYVQGIEEP